MTKPTLFNTHSSLRWRIKEDDLSQMEVFEPDELLIKESEDLSVKRSLILISMIDSFVESNVKIEMLLQQ